jgi:hypothetical protein
MLNSIKNYFFKLRNNGYNSFEYIKPKIGSHFRWEDENGKWWHTNYTKDREIEEDRKIWKPYY